MMKHLLSGVALAALLTAGLPVMAQTSSDSTKQPAAAQSGTAATGASTSMPAGTDAGQSGSTTAPSAGMSTGPAKSKAPAAADAQSGTSATGGKSSTAAGTDSARSGASTSPQSGATTSSDAMDKSSKSAKSGGKHEASASDNMAEQLNKEELQRVQNGDQPTSGTSQPPAATPSAGSTSGAH
jgi:hypothetical protein